MNCLLDILHLTFIRCVEIVEQCVLVLSLLSKVHLILKFVVELRPELLKIVESHFKTLNV